MPCKICCWSSGHNSRTCQQQIQSTSATVTPTITNTTSSASATSTATSTTNTNEELERWEFETDFQMLASIDGLPGNFNEEMCGPINIADSCDTADIFILLWSDIISI